MFSIQSKALFLNTVLTVAVLAFSSNALANRSATIRNIPANPHQAPPGTALDDIGSAIKQGAVAQDWKVIQEKPGLITALLIIRSHKATVAIQYDEYTYQIDYVDSVNLDYNAGDLRPRGSARARRNVIKGPRIHTNYNVWVRRLADSIESVSQYAYQTKTPGIRAVSPTSPVLIADELEKLDALRQRGILTQEEFDRQKEKLLN